MCALSRFLDWRLLLAAICYGALHGWIKRARARARVNFFIPVQSA